MQMAPSSRCGFPNSIPNTPRFKAKRQATLRVRSTASVHSTNAHLTVAATPIKVFEDTVRGIVCYRDERGEVICEGYDEGPRYGWRLPEKACCPWPMELRMLRLLEDAGNVVLQLKKDQRRHI